MSQQPLPNVSESPRASTRWNSSAAGWWRDLRGLAAGGNNESLGEWYGKLPPNTATVNLQIWGGVAFWRITAGWAMLAALIAAGAFARWSALELAPIVLLWLLVDPIWGALWRMAGGRNHLLSIRTGDDHTPGADTLRLPYIRENSPAAQLLSLDESNAVPWLVRIALPTGVVAIVVAAALGTTALVFTLLVALCAAAGWTWRRTLHLPPLLLHAAVLVLLPWLLATLTPGFAQEEGRWLLFTLAILWTIHAWGEAHQNVWGVNRFSILLLAVAEIAIGVALIVNKSPIYVPIVALLFVPGWLAVLRKEGATGTPVWWLAAMLVTAVAVGL